MQRDIGTIVGETRYFLGLSETDGASLAVYDMIDHWSGITDLPSRIVRRVPGINSVDLQKLAPITWL